MRLLLLALLSLSACTPPADGGKETGDTDEADADTDADTDTDTDTDTEPAGDRDGDGYADDVDCDDVRADVNPGVASDGCNDLDDDCDGTIDEDPDLQWYPDADGDGFGQAGSTAVVTCDPGGTAFATNNADCDDASDATWPGADDVCDGADNDCDGADDEDESHWLAFYVDDDGDGAGTDALVYGCDAASAGGASNALDCDDTDPLAPRFVSTTGRSSASGTFDDPLDTIQGAIDLANTCVKVDPGTYYEDLDFGGRNVLVESLGTSADTTIVGSGRSPVVTVASGEIAAALRGFTLTGGGGVQSSSSGSYWDGTQYVYYYQEYAYGGAIYVGYSSLDLEDVVVTDNVLSNSYGYYVGTDEYYYGGSSGGGLYVDGASVTLTDVDFEQNNAAHGSAIYVLYSGSGSSGTGIDALRVRILENSGEYGTAYVQSADFDARNIILDANTSTYGFSGFYLYDASLRLDNATIVDNDYAVYNYASAVTIDSSILYGNTVGLYDEYAAASAWRLSYNNVYDNNTDYSNVSNVTGTAGNLSEPPGFVAFSANEDADDDDLTLSSRSSMIDGGNPSSADPDGSIADIGAYGGPGASW